MLGGIWWARQSLFSRAARAGDGLWPVGGLVLETLRARLRRLNVVGWDLVGTTIFV
jgi:hypothetical protein